MAIDTAEKRRSASGVMGIPLIPGVTPNASKPDTWRAEAGWDYAGTAPVVPGEIKPAVWLAKPTNRNYTARSGARDWKADTGNRTWLAEGQE